jgi:RNA polymerase sigma factor (sigma-70 family)
LSTATQSSTDARLTRRAVRGSSGAFEAIFERYHQQLYRYCAAIVGNSADAQDAVQNAMVKVLQALPGEERPIELKPWLYRIAHNEAIEIVRRRLPGEEVDADSLIGPASVADQVLERERLRRLVTEVAELPERQRGTLVMRELGGLSFEDIGAALGTSAAVARQTLYEARLGLRQIGEGREMDCAEAMRAISDGDRRLLRRRTLRAHLRACEDCRAFREGIESRRADLALVAPLPAAAAAGILHGVLSGAAGGAAGAAGSAAGIAGGGSVAGSVGAATGKSLLSATAIKSAAAIGVVVAIGVTAADQRGLIHVGSGHSEASPPAKSAPPGVSAPVGAGSEAGASAPTARPSAGPVSGRGTAHEDLSSRRRVQGSPPPAQPARAAAKVVPAPAAESETPPAHTDNGKHLGRPKHPEGPHGSSAAAAESHGKSAAAPGHTKAKHVKPAHEAAIKSPPGQAKKTPPPEAAAGKKASGPAAPTAAEPSHPAHPETPSTGAEAAPEPHGKAAEPSSP